MSRRASTAGSSAQGNHEQPHPNPFERKKRTTRSAGCPDPGAEVVALQAEDLLATSRYVCTVCDKGFQRDQNLQLHMRTHNVNYELKKSGRTPARRKFYVCPIPSCVYSHRSRALSDITGIKKHFNRKHGPKNLRCPQCTKTYAVEADLKAHLKNHSLRDFQCKCGETFSRKNSYEAHVMLCSESSEESEMPTQTDVGESSAAASRRRAFNENSGLPDMNEHVQCPEGIINDEVAPLGDPTMAEQQHPSVNGQNTCDQDAREQMNRFLSLLPDDPNLLPVRFTDLLNGRYDEIIGSVYGSGVDGRPAASAPSGASHPVPPPASSLDGLREQNGKFVGPFPGSSFSLMNPTEKSPGFGSENHSLTNMCLYGTGEETSVRANSTVQNDFFGITSASLMEAGKNKSYHSTASPMLGSLPFMNNNISQQFQAPGLSESSFATALQKKGGPLSGLDMNAPMNLFQAQQQEQALPPAPAQSFLTPMPNPKLVPGITNPFFHQPQENNHSDMIQSAFSIHRQESGNISSNKSPAPSFLYDFAHSTDSNSRQKGKAPIDYVNYFPGSSMAPGNFPLGNPIQPFMDPFTLSCNIGPGHGRMMEMGGQNKTMPTDTMPPLPMAPSAVMTQNGEEAFVDGVVTMDLLGLREGGGQFHQAEAANSILPENNGGKEQMGGFFGGVDGYPSRFW